MKAAIYCRVSTDNQEREGTSLDSQKDACLAKAKELGYQVPPDNILSEAFSGATLDRPKLTELREWVRNKEIDAVIAYSFDRFSRDPVDFIVLSDEIEKHGVTLILVTESLDNTDEGKLIMHVKGYAAKIERVKIRERTMRGKKTRVEKLGKLPCGRGVLYGYDYDKVKSINTANANLDIIRMIGLWLIQEHIFLNEVCRRLDERNIPCPKGGKLWSRGTVGRLMRNSSYAGKTFANRSKAIELLNNQGKKVTKRIATSDNLIEMPNAVDRPAFTSEEWEAIQHQLKRNQELSPRNQKHTYLLKGMMYCKRCGRKLYGVPVHGKPYYRCSGRIKLLSGANCDCKSIKADWLEKTVWETVERELLRPDFLESMVKGRDEAAKRNKHLYDRIDLNKNMLAEVDEKETRYLRLYGAGLWPMERLVAEQKRLITEREHITKENQELNEGIKRIGDDTLPIDEVKARCQFYIDSLKNSDLTSKRVVLETLGWKVGVDNEMIQVECNLNPETISYLPKKDSNTVSPHL